MGEMAWQVCGVHAVSISITSKAKMRTELNSVCSFTTHIDQKTDKPL